MVADPGVFPVTSPFWVVLFTLAFTVSLEDQLEEVVTVSSPEGPDGPSASYFA